MLKNYLKIAFRNLIRHKSNTIINMVGLSVGMACCILIAMYANEELSYDRFHEKSDRIVVIGKGEGVSGGTITTPYPLADAMEEEIPEVERATRVNGIWKPRLSRDQQHFMEINNGIYAESDFFDIFSFPLIHGNKEKALQGPNQIILTLNASQKLFGKANSVGDNLYWQKRDTTLVMQVTGIAANPPTNSSLQFEGIISYTTMPARYRSSHWRAYSHHTYALLNSPEAIGKLSDRFKTLVNKHYGDQGNIADYFALPLLSFHLSELSNNAGFTGHKKYLYLFGSVALLILFIACVNYVNLTTARVSTRAKEVGIRKSVGARKGQVAAQFFGESMLLSLAAYFLGILTAGIALPFFNQLFGTSLSWNETGLFLVWLGFGGLLIGFLTGCYPALYLSGFAPSSIFRSNLLTGSTSVLLRKILVVGQFGIALILIIGSMVIYNQLQYTQTKDLGFNGEQVVVVDLPNEQVWQIRNDLRARVLSHPGILEASVANGVPGTFMFRIGLSPEKFSSHEQSGFDGQMSMAPAVVDYNFIEMLDIKLLAGRNFSEGLVADKEQAYILNRSAVEQLGWTPEEAIGKIFNLRKEGKVVGVVENFHITSLRSEIEPVSLQLQESGFSGSGMLLARLHPDRIREAIDFLRGEMAKYASNRPMEYKFLDEKFDAMYRTEERLGNVTAIFTFIAILIACLGLYGLAAFATERRTKEIGIRKTMGATITNLVTLLSKDFLKLVLIGFVIAVPIAWYAMHQWLQDFAYRIDLSWWYFVAAGLLALVIAWLTVGFHTVRAAMVNPGECLRDE